MSPPPVAANPVLTDARGDDLTAFEYALTEHFQLVWRCLRRFGVSPEDAVDDAAQQVFEIAAKKRPQIAPGSERGFLVKTAALVALEVFRENKRRAKAQTREMARLAHSAGEARPDEALETEQWRARLDQVLDALPQELRTVFVLFELEELTGPEIATLLGLAEGTVASRLRRARKQFRAAATRLRTSLGLKEKLP
ncbi:MAG: sigma-70 family RNA polymerase sigma factor [Polyangiaceae bacterium]|nr:sigma-70 family RNA polymerase sigma factor [Polyangiaceae bacterium]